jgi:hypothetical protein
MERSANGHGIMQPSGGFLLQRTHTPDPERSVTASNNGRSSNATRDLFRQASHAFVGFRVHQGASENPANSAVCIDTLW